MEDFSKTSGVFTQQDLLESFINSDFHISSSSINSGSGQTIVNPSCAYRKQDLLQLLDQDNIPGPFTSYTSLMEQIISSQNSMLDGIDDIPRKDTAKMENNIIQDEDEEIEHWSLDLFNLQQNEKETNSMNKNLNDSVQSDIHHCENQHCDDVQNQDDVTEEDIEQYLIEEQLQASKGNNAEVDRKYIPEIGMKFKSIDEAQHFFNFYALLAGFSVVNAHSYHSSKKRNREIIRVTFKCNKQGKGDDQGNSKEIEKMVVSQRNTSKVIQTDCKCVLVILERNKLCEITRLDLEHNHELSPQEVVRFLRSHKYLSSEEKLLIRTLKECHIPTRNMIVILSFLRGVLTSLSYTKKDISNVRTSINRETSNNDMMQVLQFFKKKEEQDSNFFYEFDLDDDRRVKNLFWTNGRSIDWYAKFGDCVSFDTTFLTNRYNLPFAPVGISGHGNTIIFGCAFLHDETTETFKWLFTAFLKAMSGKQPCTVIADQDGAMRSAIAQIFPNSKYRNCLFHIVSKALNRSGSLFKKKKGLYAEYDDIINNSLTEEEFVFLWKDMIERYDLHDINFLQNMWENRKRFIPVYFKKDFCPFIHSIALSEGTNSRFKRNIGPQYSTTNFMIEYDRVMDTIQNLEQQDDHISRTKKPSSFWSHFYIEYQAVQLYNSKIFKKFQVQLKSTTRLQVEEVEKMKQVFVANNQLVQEVRSRKYLVLIDAVLEKFSCVCAMFEKDGILCSHILKVMLDLNISKIPKKYIISRWRKKQSHSEVQSSKRIILVSESSTLRFNILSRKCAEITSIAAKQKETYEFFMEEFDKIQNALSDMNSEKKNEESVHIDQIFKVNVNYEALQQPEELRDPDIAKSKGRPQQRYKTIRERIEDRKVNHCSHCGRTDHTFPKCTFKHMEFNLPSKKKRKSTNQPQQHFKTMKKRNESSVGKSGYNEEHGNQENNG
uniref:SWIM-type domain-containing protein n=1 Tax=Oryza brachyantha TaxID=4533 RepID=J3MVQ9_ORYBR